MFEPPSLSFAFCNGLCHSIIRLLCVTNSARRLTSAAGATITQIFSYVETFYGDDAREADALNLSVSRQPVDRAFRENVWKWLTRHPDVYVGRNREGNQLTLEEAETSSAPRGIEQGAHHALSDSQQKRSRNTGFDKFAPSVQAEQTFTTDAKGKEAVAGTLRNGDQTNPTTARTQAPLDDADSATSQSKVSKTLRVHVSEERIWYAVAGHTPDSNRVQRMDFILLSIIAANRGKGILQPELTRISGQDKRSTPVRTQRLHDNGYIEKKKVQTRGQVTSLCTLRKFVASTSQTTPDPTGVTDEVIRRDTSATIAGPQEELIDIKAMLRRIFDILNELNIITHIDLKRKLVSFPSHAQLQYES